MDVWATLKFVIMHHADRRNDSYKILYSEILIVVYSSSFFLYAIKWMWKYKYMR